MIENVPREGMIKVNLGYDEFYLTYDELGVDPDDIFVHELDEVVREYVLELIEWDWRIVYNE